MSDHSDFDWEAIIREIESSLERFEAKNSFSS